MKGLIAGILSVLLVIGIVKLSLFNWQYDRDYAYALKLADDASLPQAKADYLKEYLEKIKDIKAPVAYVFTKPDYDLNKQKVILQGLITRCEDIAKIAPSDMAYQTGITQLNQEVEHQLKRINDLFKSARYRESGCFPIWTTVVIVTSSILVIWGMVAIGIAIG